MCVTCSVRENKNVQRVLIPFFSTDIEANIPLEDVDEQVHNPSLTPLNCQDDDPPAAAPFDIIPSAPVDQSHDPMTHSAHSSHYSAITVTDLQHLRQKRKLTVLVN